MKEIVVISGKGGTGKTSITASFAMLGKRKLLLADCDVDAADMHLLMKPDFGREEDFYSGYLAEIDTDKCTECGLCSEKCRFDAINNSSGNYKVDKLSCEGCGYCAKICPEEAISMTLQNVGQLYVSKTKINSTLVHAKLGIGAENSGKLVAKVKNEAKKIAQKKNIEYILVDGSPGIGCPVVSSLSGADFVVLVTEPTVSGLHDLKRVFQLVKKFKIPAGCIINKYDLNIDVSDEIERFLKTEGIKHISSIPYTETFSKALIKGNTIIEEKDKNLKAQLTKSWDSILSILK